MRAIVVYLMPLAVQTYLIFRSRQIATFLYNSVTTLSVGKKQLLQKYSVASLGFHVCFIAFDLVLDVFWYLGFDYEKHDDVIFRLTEDKTYQLTAFVITAFTYAALTRRWILVTANIYFIALISWSTSLFETMEVMKRCHFLDRKVCSNLISMKKRYDSLKKQFNHTFAILLFLIFAALFIESSSLLILLKMKGFTVLNMIRVGLYAVNMVMLVSLVVFIIHVEAKESSGYESLLDDWRLRLVDVDIAMKENLDDVFNKREPLSAIFFTIDKPLFLNFASSLATITVMIVQLIQPD
ncbi:hypothetical protein HDE_06133 [Halotydeus destructor]|nr:hypothetical protein HDE_06133 [Halotydeus destructor]